MLAPIFSAISESFAIITDRFILKHKKIDSNTFVATLFIFLALISLSLLFIFEVSYNQLTPLASFILFMIIIGAILQNWLFYFSLKNRNLSLLEPIRNSEPILVIAMAFLIFPDERNILIIILGVITTIALIYAHLEKNKLKIALDRYAAIAFSAVLISALLNLAYKYVLEYISPISLYIFRSIGVAIILSLLIRPKITSIEKKQLLFFIISALLYSAAFILKFLAIKQVGVSITILILALSPTIIYIFSYLLLKEKITKNQIIASIVIILCIIATIII